MAIADTDILYKLSIKTGTAGNQNAQADPNQSLGKYISTTQISAVLLNNLFDDVSGDENVLSDVEYRSFFVHNNHATLTWQAVFMWLSAEVAGGASIAIGKDPAGWVPLAQAAAQGAEIANEGAAPGSVTFSAPTTKGAGVSLGNGAAGNVHQIWVRRTAANNAAVNNDGWDHRLEGDTAA